MAKALGGCWRPRLGAALASAAVLALCACVSVEVGNDAGTQVQFRLVDQAGATAAEGAPAGRTIGRDLLVNPIAGSSIDDSFSLAFSRSPQQRAAYQFASWSERPSSRLATLAVERLAARRVFNSVTVLGRGVAGDLQLNLLVNDFYHDASSSPGTARVGITAELIDRNSRRLLARQRFEATAAVEQANAASAAAALSRASTLALDALVAWVEKAAAPAALAALPAHPAQPQTR